MRALLPRPVFGERVGVRGRQITKNLLKNDFTSKQYIIIPESDHPKTFGLQRCSALLIFRDLLEMLPAIELNDQL